MVFYFFFMYNIYYSVFILTMHFTILEVELSRVNKINYNDENGLNFGNK